MLKGTVQSGKLSVDLDGKARSYRVETSAYIGPIGAKPSPDNSSGSSVPPSDLPEESSTTPSVKSAAHVERPVESASAPSKESDRNSASSNAAKVMVSSEPSGADIYFDGNFMGNTPSLVQLVPGSHEIRIEAKGHKAWSRTINLTSGSKVTVQATLDAEQ